MRPILVEIFGVPIWAYGVSLTVAFVVGAWLGAKRARAAGMDGEHVWNVAIWAFVSALVGARLAHILVERPELLGRPREWLSVWQGGLVFYGGFIAAVLSSLAYARLKRLDFRILTDVLAPVMALGHGIVRVGCFFNGCCYGRPAEWGVVFPSLRDGVSRQPTQLYEAAAGAMLFAGLLLWEKRRRRAGEVFLLYLAAYGLARFLIEFARADDRGGTFWGLTMSQHLGLAALAGGVAAFMWRRPAAPSSATGR
ncbi:MAG: prolipoprotein diacylglyceryl transferase [Planctomycetes bacterium]|nr:prolipoprotein diacylglyceryl transferase [Planctomycetota bacterium]